MIEYKIVAAESPLSENQLSDLGKEWWSLIHVLKYENIFWHYFSRVSGGE